MGLYKRGRSGIWWMSFIYRGEQVRQSTETIDRKLAQRIYDKVKGEIAENRWFEKLPGEEKTFGEMMEKYLNGHSAMNKAPSSHIRDKSLANHLLASFEGLTLIDITPKLIAEYKTKRREEGASPRTVNYELTLMSHAFNLAIKEWEWCKENPVRKVSKERVNNLRVRWLTLEEEEALLKESPRWLQEMIAFSINTGLRQGEILNLQWPQIDRFRKTMTIFEQKNKGKDTLPLNEKALEVLKARTKVRHIKNNYVFYSANGTPIDASNLRRIFYSATQKAQIEDFHWHDLRHTFATRLVQAGVDIYTVQKLGRWKNISMVMRYAHHYPESLRSGIVVLDRFREKVSTNLAQSDEKQEVSSV
jgi:integrase